MTSKQQERETLQKIKEMVESLGNNSYVATAFEGCFEIAEDNIENDMACSLAERCADLERENDGLNVRNKRLNDTVKILADLSSNYEKLYEKELEWKPYVDTDNVRQKDYEDLTSQRDTKYLTDDEAKDILYDWYGFAKDKIKVRKSIPKYEINRHGEIRKDGEIDRRPVYNATDWNYIRFDCGVLSYELYNDDLRFWIH